MKFSILTEPSQTDAYVEAVQSFADSHRKALGFLPKSAYSDQSSNGHLWIAACTEKKQCLGYLMFGGRFPTLRIFQLFVSKKYRRQQIGSTLLSKFEAYAEGNYNLSVNARVAADLASNKFWDKSGYGNWGWTKAKCRQPWHEIKNKAVCRP